VRIESLDGHLNAIVLTNPTDSGNYQDESKLAFHRFGMQYILAQVWIAGTSESYLIKSPAGDEFVSDIGVRAKPVMTFCVRQR
jgi:hypothetical protein